MTLYNVGSERMCECFAGCVPMGSFQSSSFTEKVIRLFAKCFERPQNHSVTVASGIRNTLFGGRLKHWICFSKVEKADGILLFGDSLLKLNDSICTQLIRYYFGIICTTLDITNNSFIFIFVCKNLHIPGLVY